VTLKSHADDCGPRFTNYSLANKAAEYASNNAGTPAPPPECGPFPRQIFRWRFVEHSSCRLFLVLGLFLVLAFFLFSPFICAVASFLYCLLWGVVAFFLADYLASGCRLYLAIIFDVTLFSDYYFVAFSWALPALLAC